PKASATGPMDAPSTELVRAPNSSRNLRCRNSVRSLRTCAPYRRGPGRRTRICAPRPARARSHLADLLRPEGLPQQVERLLLGGLAGGGVVDVVERLVPRVEAGHGAAARRAVVVRVVRGFVRPGAGPRVVRGAAGTCAAAGCRAGAGTPGLRATGD